MTPSADGPWAWPENPEAQGRNDLADLLEQAARALRDGHAVVHRSAVSRATPGPVRIDVDVSWTPPGSG